MDLSWLETFLAVVRHRSFTRASETLDLTQPGVSRQIQKLERELGVSLFERRSAGVRLTPEGERFLAFAQQTLDRYAELRRELHGGSSEVSGDLRIAASTTPGELLVPELIAAFCAEHPAVRPQVSVSDSMTVFDALRARTWDVGFVGARMPMRWLRFQPIAEDEVLLLVPAGHPFAGRGAIELRELAGQAFIERDGSSGTQLAVRQALIDRGLTMPAYRAAMVLDSTQAMISVIRQGHAIGWISSLALENASMRNLAVVRIAGLPLQRVLHFVYEPDRDLPRAAQTFISWLEARLRGGSARESALAAQ